MEPGLALPEPPGTPPSQPPRLAVNSYDRAGYRAGRTGAIPTRLETGADASGTPFMHPPAMTARRRSPLDEI